MLGHLKEEASSNISKCSRNQTAQKSSLTLSVFYFKLIGIA